jgi:HlyD family secretion protein
MYKLITLGMLLISLTINSCGVKVNNSKSDKNKKNIPHFVVKKGKIAVTLEETGEILPIKVVKVKSKISGKITKLLVEEGNYIHQGDIIAKVEPDFNQANQINKIKDNLKLAKINLRKSKKNYKDKLKLFQSKYISQDDITDAKDRLTESEINYNSALAQFELIKDIEIKNNVSEIRSSATGTIIKLLLEEGEMVTASSNSFSEGTVVAQVADLKNMIVKSSINEIDISKIHKNQKVKIKIDAYPDDLYYGVITKVAESAKSENNIKVFPVEIKIENSSENIKPGMTANITINGETKTGILIVPIRGIFSDNLSNDIVYKLKNNKILKPVIVKTGINDFQNVEIVNGVVEGDTISLVESRPNREKKSIKIK